MLIRVKNACFIRWVSCLVIISGGYAKAPLAAKQTYFVDLLPCLVLCNTYQLAYNVIVCKERLLMELRFKPSSPNYPPLSLMIH